MAFEFDPAKSARNRAAHGIDFLEARALWNDPDRIEIPARSTTEPRFMVIGRIDRKLWACVCTYRTQTIRLISCRRARRDEIREYLDRRI
jgi:uncharacterized protein